VSRKKDPRRWLLEAMETPEQREQRIRREAARRERRLRRELAKVGLTLEEFEEGCREFARKFQGGCEQPFPATISHGPGSCARSLGPSLCPGPTP
jgi:hypothetical protein